MPDDKLLGTEAPALVTAKTRMGPPPIPIRPNLVKRASLLDSDDEDTPTGRTSGSWQVIEAR